MTKSGSKWIENVRNALCEPSAVVRSTASAEAVGVEVSELRFARAVLQQRKELRRTKASEATRGGC